MELRQIISTDWAAHLVLLHPQLQAFFVERMITRSPHEQSHTCLIFILFRLKSKQLLTDCTLFIPQFFYFYSSFCLRVEVLKAFRTGIELFCTSPIHFSLEIPLIMVQIWIEHIPHALWNQKSRFTLLYLQHQNLQEYPQHNEENKL